MKKTTAFPAALPAAFAEEAWYSANLFAPKESELVSGGNPISQDVPPFILY
jgi:hypothetical protein